MLALLLPVSFAFAQGGGDTDATPQEQIAALTRERDKAIARVKEIVNQPITHLPRSPWARISTYSPGWFHPGAIVPNFNTVDIRATQELHYAQSHFVSSDLNPNEMFLGSELEFNPMTKYFYTDRTLPKKKLSEQEMLEINRLYRIIGECQTKLAALQHPGMATYLTSGSLLYSPFGVIAQLLLLSAVFIFFYRKLFRPR
jgi:hypothetical protein